LSKKGILGTKMATSADRRKQLEYHLNAFREISEQRWQEKAIRWSYHIPAMVSATLVICQFANIFLFGTFSYNFGKLYILLDKYMLETNGSILVDENRTITYQYEGINQERINQIDLYHDQLWSMSVAEVIELIFPMINLVLFAWLMHDRTRKLRYKVKAIYLLCPALSLMLSISQACMIHVTLSEAVYTIRFLLAKIFSTLLVFNKHGRLPIEEYFGCEFYNDDDIVKPSCAGTIHDQVVSPFTLNLMIGIHIVPVIVFLCLLIKNLTNNKMEHLFLYIESVDGDGRPTAPIEVPPGQNRLLRHSLNDILSDFEINFCPKIALNNSSKKKPPKFETSKSETRV
jgi:hypothetical protein